MASLQTPEPLEPGIGSRSVAHRIARIPSGRRMKYVIVLFWLAVILVGGTMAGKLQSAENNDASAWLPAKAESTQALKLQATFMSRNIYPAVVVYSRPSGITQADRIKAAADARAFARLHGVHDRVTGPAPSADGKAIVTVAAADLGNRGWNGAATFVDAVRKIAANGSPGLSVHITGPAGNAADSGKAIKGIDGTLLYATLAVVIVLLLLTYRSPVLWLLPVLSAGVALITAEAVIYLLATHAGLTVNAQSAGILTVLVLGAGTDYALLLIARYREELRKHSDRHEAMAVALRRAGPAIIASAGTVTAGMLCMLIAESNATQGLGPVAAIGIAVGLLAIITLLPALLVIFGRWLFWPLRPKYGSVDVAASGIWARTGNAIGRRPRSVWIVTALVLGGLAIGITGLRADGLSAKDSFRTAPDSVVGEQVLARHFPAGAGQPVVVIGRAHAAPQLAAALSGPAGISSVSKPAIKDGLAYLEGTLVSAPDSQAAYTTIDRVRANVHAVPGADAKVGGATATSLDSRRIATHDRNVVIPVVLLVVLVILALLLRAMVAPVILIATVVLSFAAALGASALLFTHVFGFAGADASLPLYVFVFLVALGIDYNIFLMSRIREESARVGTRRGTVVGLAMTGGVISSAGAVLGGTFAMLGTLPMVMFAEIGFAVAIGVLLDTLVVRSVLVTALTLDIGRRMWWPGRLASRDGYAQPAPPSGPGVTGRRDAEALPARGH
jgi:putative drug exporter of the RND superfamily